MSEYEYVPDKIYPVRTALGITTQIELSPHEKVLDYSTGFSSGWELTRRENVFYLKPKNVDVDITVRSYPHAWFNKERHEFPSCNSALLHKEDLTRLRKERLQSLQSHS